MSTQRRLTRPGYRCAILIALIALAGWSRPIHAQTLTAVITYPANLAINADLSVPIQWTSVPNVQAYYLYVGSTPGAKDLVNTGEILQTSYGARGLPGNQTIYARLWTKVNGVWRYVDSSFSVGPVLRARITYPADGAVAAEPSPRVEWTTVANAQAYYLYVGTTIGAKDLVNTGETQQTSYLVKNLPIRQTLYARMWTKVGGTWRYLDSTFSASPVLKATITYPANGAVDLEPPVRLQWTAVPNAQAYYLYVGTTAGAKDVVNTGETLQTSYLANSLPPRQTLHARLWTKFEGIWRYVDTTFSVAVPRATLLYPANGAANVDQTQPFTWTAVDNVQAYTLYVGSTPGAKDLLNTNETRLTTFLTAKAGPPLPTGVTLHARLWTKAGNVWGYRDSTFTVSPIAPQFIYPTDGAVAVDPATPFRWTPPVNAQAHQLRIGTAPGASDVFTSGTLTAPSIVVPGLSRTGTLYARALSKVNGFWTFTDIAFTLDASVAASAIVVPANGQLGFDTVHPFQWAPVPLARGYRLTIGTAPGLDNLHNSGDLEVTRRFVPNLPLGPLFGRVQTRIDGQWYSRDFSFVVGANSVSEEVQIQSAFWATHFVRSMSGADNRAYSWTQLAARKYSVDCADYATTLLNIWAEVNGQLPVRRLDVTLNPNPYDAHTLAELFNPQTNTWMVLDPTFDLTVKRTTDNGWATAEDVSAATRTQQWGDISYVFLGSLGDYYARRYAIDYPLLFVNVYHAGQKRVNGEGGPVLPYMLEVPMPSSGSRTWYAVGCSDTQTTVLRIDGVDQTIDCSGVDGLSRVFGATTIVPSEQTPPSVKVYRPQRYVF